MPRHHKMAPATTIPASLILTSHEQKHYRRYQRTNTTLDAHQQGFLPTAKEYTVFQCWLKQRDSGYFSDAPLPVLAPYVRAPFFKDNVGKVASLCQHTLHPSHSGDEQSCCPICTVEMHVRYVRLLKKHIRRSDQNVRQQWEDSPDRDPVLEAWRAGKLAILRAIGQLEDHAVKEQHWTSMHPDECTENAKTAQHALQLYYATLEQDSMSASPQSSESESSSAASATSSASSPMTSQNTSTGAKKERRSVSFDSDTSFTLGRPPPYFWRKHPRYEAGKYAIVVTSEVTLQLGYNDCSEQDSGDFADDEKDESACADALYSEDDDQDDENDKKKDGKSGRSVRQAKESVKIDAPSNQETNDDDSDWESISTSDSFDSDSELDDDDIAFDVEDASFIVFEN
ncbi:hypothetical protein K458DRAFT_186027 [Lentithecium fluviatile CBS 122367]|uniref:Uncharacterized protein n=1 Tax=Lentithecium fluviatile CBS 122367 TaxID=1168545 RepID=A0A6G1JAE6_9PLEO|nr:hypothetical protein K458DRAFT_186027 [Lentithecium fluviatile CBS 122367]